MFIEKNVGIPCATPAGVTRIVHWLNFYKHTNPLDLKDEIIWEFISVK